MSEIVTVYSKFSVQHAMKFSVHSMLLQCSRSVAAFNDLPQSFTG